MKITPWQNMLTVLSLFVVMIVGCSNPALNQEGNSSGTTLSSNTEDSSTADTSSFRTVTTLAGTVDIPVNPQNIVLTYDDDVDHFMALGLKPSTVPMYNRTDNVNGYFPYLADQLEGVAVYDLQAGLEPILAANPDLIVAGYFHKDYLADLQKMAPTIFVDWQVDWRETHLEMGRLLGLEEKAQANVDLFNNETEKTKAYLDNIIGDQPVAFIRVRQNQLELYGGAGTGSSASFILYDLLGLTPVKDAPTDDWGGPFSLERFASLEAEHIFLNVQENEENNALVQELLTNPLYKDIPAIKKGQVYEVYSYPWERGGPIAFTKGMEQIRELVKQP